MLPPSWMQRFKSRAMFTFVGGVLIINPVYAQDTQGTPPSVWVVKADDYKRARELLMEAGLLDETRTGSSYVPETLQFKEAPKLPQRQRIGRMRIALLFAVGAMAFWTILRMFFLR